MSSLPPDPFPRPTAPGAPPGAPGAGQPEILASGHGSAVPPTRRPRTGLRTGLLGGAALLLVAGLGVGGFVGWRAYFATGPQPAEALPASTVGYLSLDLDPAGRQKLAARETLEKVPALDDRIDTDSEADLRASLFERLQDAGACPDLDWADDVDPWLGDRVAVAAVDLGERDDDTDLGVTPVLVVQVDDAEAADAGLEEVLECTVGGEVAESGSGSGELTDTFGWSVRGGWAVVATSTELAEAVTDAAAEEPLSDDDDFRRWTGAAGDPGVLTAYAAPDAGDLLAEAVGRSAYGGEEEPPDAETQDVLADYFADFGGAGVQVRFADGGLEVESASSADLLATAGYGPLTESDGGDDVLATLPDDTAAALGVGFEPGWVGALLDSASSTFGAGMGVDVDELLSSAEAELGLELPEDAEALFGSSAALAVGPGLDPDADDPGDVDVAVKIQGDPDRIEEVLEKLRDHPEADDEVRDVLAHEADGDHVVVGPNGDYREEVLDRGDLGSSDAFEDVVPEAGRAGAVLFVDVDAFDDLLEAEEGDEELVENLEVLAAVGYSTWTDDDVAHAVLKVTTDD